MISESNGLVVLLVPGAEQERDPACSRASDQLLDELGLVIELFRIAASELVPARGIVAEPFPELVAGSELLHPPVQRGSLPREPARPQAIDQDAKSIVRSRRPTDTPDRDLGAHGGSHGRWMPRSRSRYFYRPPMLYSASSTQEVP